MNEADELERLTLIADELEAIDVRRERLYAERLRIWQSLRGRGYLQKQLAAPSRCTEGAVTQALRKPRLAADASA